MSEPTHSLWQHLRPEQGGPCWELIGLYGDSARAHQAVELVRTKYPQELFALMRVESGGPIEPPALLDLRAVVAELARIQQTASLELREHLERCLEQS